MGRVGRDLKDHLLPTPVPWQGHLHQTSLPRAHPDMGHSYFSGQPVPGPHHLHCKDICPYIQSKPTFFYYPLPCHYTPTYKVPLQLLVGSFRYWKAAVRCPPHSFLFSRLEDPNSLSPSSLERCSIPVSCTLLLVGLLESSRLSPHGLGATTTLLSLELISHSQSRWDFFKQRKGRAEQKTAGRR